MYARNVYSNKIGFNIISPKETFIKLQSPRHFNYGKRGFSFWVGERDCLLEIVLTGNKQNSKKRKSKHQQYHSEKKCKVKVGKESFFDTYISHFVVPFVKTSQ